MNRPRQLSLRDKIALIYTSAGSQRNVALLTGLSHQKIGRILHHPEFGGYADTSRVWTDPATIAAIEVAFEIHTDLAQSQARDDGLPFDPRVPVFARRLPMHRTIRRTDKATGEIYFEKQYHPDGSPVMVPGMRVVVDHAHWMPDELRRQVFNSVNRSRFYHNGSVGSWVDLKSYFKQGEQYWKEQRKKGKYRNDKQRAHRENLKRKIQRGQSYGFIYTPMVPLQMPIDAVMFNLDGHINAKHAPAGNDPKSLIASQILLQTDIKKDRIGGAGIPKAPTNAKRKSASPKRAPRTNRGDKRR